VAFQFKAIGQGQPSSADGTPLGRAVDELAKALGLQPVTSPDLAKALRHFVTCVHPTVGQGGMLLFDLVAVISRAVLDRSVERYGQVNPDDVAVIAGGSPVRLLNFYRGQLPNHQFHQGVMLEGWKASANAEENDALWLAKNDQFEKQNLVARNFVTDSAITVLAVMRAIPARLLGDVTEERIKEIGDEIAAKLAAQGYPASLLTHSEARRLVAEKRQELATAGVS
jgi:hypothetical protein